MELVFSAYQLIVSKRAPTLDDLLKIEYEQYSNKDNTYKVEAEIIDDRFYWLHAQYGKALPYSNEVVDRKTEETIVNPRNKNHVELNKQLFCLFDDITKIFYISNTQKRKFLEEYLKSKMHRDITIKRFFLSPQEFIEQIKTIDKISFTSVNNLFSSQSGLFEDTKDIFGLGEPIDFKININYNHITKTSKFIEFFNSFLNKNINQEIQSLVCIGKDDSDIESIFDINSYTQKRALNLKKDTEGLFDIELVKTNLINELLGKKESKNV